SGGEPGLCDSRNSHECARRRPNGVGASERQICAVCWEVLNRSQQTLTISRSQEMRAGLCSRGEKDMRTLVVGTLSVILAGCGCLNSPQAMLEGCTSQACYDRTVAATPLEITPAPFTPSHATVSNPSATRAKPKKIARTTAPSSAKPAPVSAPV